MKIIEKSFSDIDLTEGEGSIRLHFLALCANKKGGSGNIYSQQILQQASDEFNKKIERHGMAYGGLGHKKGSLEVDDVSHVLEHIDYSPEKRGLMVTAKIIPTSKGRTISTLLKNSARIGVSMRGTGKTDDKGNVQEYHIEGCDFVLNPSQDIYVDKANLYESQPLDEVELDLLDVRYRSAVQAGFQGTKEQYSKDVLQPLLEAKKTDIGLPHQQEDGEPEDERLTVAKLLESAVTKQVGPNVWLYDFNEDSLTLFDSSKSEWFEMKYTRASDGSIKIAGGGLR